MRAMTDRKGIIYVYIKSLHQLFGKGRIIGLFARIGTQDASGGACRLGRERVYRH